MIRQQSAEHRDPPDDPRIVVGPDSTSFAGQTELCVVRYLLVGAILLGALVGAASILPGCKSESEPGGNAESPDTPGSSARKPSILEVVAKGQEQTVKDLLAGGAEVNNVQTRRGHTLLHVAVRPTLYSYGLPSIGHPRLVKLLLANGAMVDAADRKGRTPLHWASEMGQKGIAEQLLAAGAKLDLRDNSGYTPLFVAVRRHKLDLVTFLAAKGADLNTQANNGLTPLTDLAMGGGDSAVTIAKALLDGGADPNRMHEGGMAPLHWAALRGKTEIAEVLLAHGAAVNAPSKKKGLSPLHLALREGRKDVGALLIAKGADVNAKDKAGHTPLHYKGMFPLRQRGALAELIEKHGGK